MGKEGKVLGGYTKKILRVNLSLGKIWVEEENDEFLKKYGGGYGTAGRILYDEVPPWVEPFDPENRLIFTTGPVTGTITQTAGRFTTVCKSPLSGYFGDSSCGGFWGPELKLAGYDMIVFHGRAPKPVYLWVNNEQVEIRDASAYWGMDARKVDRALKSDLGDKKIQVACIGPAGENLVRFAAVMHDEAGRAAGRLGTGAIMGHKQLKAIAVRGNKPVPVAEPDRLKELMKEISKHYAKHEEVTSFRRGGTPSYFASGWEIGDTNSYNFADENWGEYDPKAISWPGNFDKVLVGNRTCYVCAVACRRISGAGEGEYKLDEGNVEGLEYENMTMLGSNCGITDIYALNKINDLCNLYGIDTISAGGTIAFAMECYERGIISKEDTDGIDLRFGNADAEIEILRKITYREGFGNILAEGTRRAAGIIGNGAMKYAIQIKGVELAAHDPRAFQGGGPHYACTITGGRHTEGITVIWEPFKIPYPEIGIYGGLDPQTTEGKGRLAKLLEDWWCFINVGGWCLFSSDILRYIGKMTNYTDAFSAVTGLKYTVEDAMKLGERVFNLRKAFNMRHGCTREEDTLPERLLKEPNKRAGNSVVKLDETLPEYYRERGWDPNKSLPTREKLRELGLNDIADDLWGK
ncbi:MAG: aldehyde ferredoxin oxidoreductase family protein [Nitrososphaerales archaeon]